MIKRKRIEAYMHYTMSIVGGFMGAYALLNRGGNFGSSETANMINIVTALLGRNFPDFLIRLASMVIYILGIQFTVLLPKFVRVDMRRIAVAGDAVGIVLLAFMPLDIHPLIALYPMFFVMAMQWNVFSGADGYVSSTIFSTNNLRQFAIACGELIYNRKDEKMRGKAKFYGLTLLTFHIGVAVSYFSTKWLGTKGIFICLAPLAVCWMLVRLHHKPAELRTQMQTA